MPEPLLASVDGRISAPEAATIPVADDGLLRGDGVFELIRVYGGRPFALAEHLDRLERSAVALAMPVERAEVERDTAALIERAGAPDCNLRIVLTRAGRRLLLLEPRVVHPDSLRVATVTYAPTVVLNGVKSLSYAANMQATRLAVERGADEAILVRPDGVVLEAPTSSIFWISPEGGLRTPSLEVGILDSITRSQLVREMHVEEGAWSVDDLLAAPEAFLASTTREVQAVSQIDGRSLGEVPGPRTRHAQEVFAGVLGTALA